MDLNEYKPVTKLPVLQRTDQIGGILFFIAVFFKLQHLPYASLMMIVSLTTLSLVSIIKGTIQPNKKEQVLSFMRKMIHYSIAIGIVSALFIIQNWPSAHRMRSISGSNFILCTLFALGFKMNVFKQLDFNEKIKFGGALMYCFIAV